jgi:hypothetical protein
MCGVVHAANIFSMQLHVSMQRAQLDCKSGCDHGHRVPAVSPQVSMSTWLPKFTPSATVPRPNERHLVVAADI